MLSMEFPLTNCLSSFFQTDGNFYQILSHTLGRGPNESLVKKIVINATNIANHPDLLFPCQHGDTYLDKIDDFSS